MTCRTQARGSWALSRMDKWTLMRRREGTRALPLAGPLGWRGPGTASHSASGVGNAGPRSWHGDEMTEGDVSLTWTTFELPQIWEAGHVMSLAVTKRHQEGLTSNGRR